MSRIQVMRTAMEMPTEAALKGASQLIFGALDGFSADDRRAWRRLWKRLRDLEPGELLVLEAVFPRSGPYHRRHMAIEQAVFDAQEKFSSFNLFVQWVKIGAGWVTWVPGAKGGIVPLPKSISYSKADKEEFTRFHEAVMAFFRGGHAAHFLWKHLGDKAQEMMETVLEGFDE